MFSKFRISLFGRHKTTKLDTWVVSMSIINTQGKGGGGYLYQLSNIFIVSTTVWRTILTKGSVNKNRTRQTDDGFWSTCFVLTGGVSMIERTQTCIHRTNVGPFNDTQFNLYWSKISIKSIRRILVYYHSFDRCRITLMSLRRQQQQQNKQIEKINK